MAKREKKKKPEKVDGLSPENLKRLRSAIRQVWQWSHMWRLAKKRALGADGFERCENKKCPAKGKPVPKIFVDHIHPAGEVTDPGYIERMFTPSKNLQAWCKKCHDAKTKAERQAVKPKRKIKSFL